MRESAASRLVLARSAQHRLTAVRTWLEELPDHSEAVLVGPHRGAADDLLRRTGRPWFGIHRLTVGQLAHDLAALPLARTGHAPVAGLPVEALAARALDLHREQLSYFAPVARTPGFGRSLARTLLELRGNDISTLEVERSGPSGPDLAVLLQTYEELLRDRGLADPPAVMEVATQVSSQGPHRLLSLPVVLLDPLPHTRRERDFLATYVAQAPISLVTGAADDDQLLEHLRELVPGVEPEDLDADPPTSRLGRVRARLFVGEIGTDLASPGDEEETTEGPEDFEVFAAPGETRECAEIARRLRDLAADGVPFDRTALAIRDPDLYLPLLEETFTRAGIPFWPSRGTVRPDPAGRAFLALLACAEEKLSASRFAEYLSLGQVPNPAADTPDDVGLGEAEAVQDSPDQTIAPAATTESEVPWVEPAGEQLVLKSPPPPAPSRQAEVPPAPPRLRTPRRWERLLVDAAVVGGRDRWRRRLRGLENELERRSAEAEDPAPFTRRLERLRELERFALPVIDELDGLPRQATWGRWITALEKLATLALSKPHSVLRVLADLRPMDRVGPVPLAHVRRVLDDRLRTLRLEPERRRSGSVFVATPEELLGRSFRVVFLPGLAEGLFPRRTSEDPLLLDEHRQGLAALPTREDRIRDERRLLRITVGAAEERLVASWPRLDLLRGRSRVPSLYALDLLRAAEGRLPDLPEIETMARAAAPSTLGWPAPEAPESAIDDAEFDLAWLAPLLRPGATGTHGKARYLLSVNDNLDRSLRRRWLQWHVPSSLTPADGLVDGSPEVLEALAPHRLKARSYSPTALQHYSACPYRFLLSAIHRLRPRDEAEPLEQMDPLTRGSLFHEVQFRLFQDLASEGRLPMRLEDRDLLFDRADQALDGAERAWADQLAPAIDTIWKQEIENIRADLRGWIQTVLERDTGWTPAHFELAFGLRDREGHDPSSSTEPVTTPNGAHLRGSIDLVEVDTGRGVLRVTDHKTGVYRGRRDLVVGGGATLQPVLYALAAEGLLGRPVESGRLFFCTRRGDFRSVEVPFGDEERGAADRVLEEVDHAIETGLLPALPWVQSRTDACRYCDFRPVCGPDEVVRTEQKRVDPRARRLDDLRRMP